MDVKGTPVTAAKLRKKFPHSRRACDASGADVPEEYCVGGALCIEVLGQNAMHFPDDEHLIQAIKTANPYVETAWMKDEEYQRWRSKVTEIQARNDIGDFKGAWAALDVLLEWPETPMPDFTKDDEP